MFYSEIVNEDVERIISDCGARRLKEKLQDRVFLITGASGMIGSYFIYTLQKLNELYGTNTAAIAVVRNPDKLDRRIVNDKNVRVITADVVDPLSVEGKVDYIVHAASPASPKIMSTKPVETNFANTIGTANTLLLAKEKKAKSYMFVSSREIYGEPAPGQELFTEDGPLGQVNPLVPRNGYAEGKKAAENMCSGFADEYGLCTKIVRLAHTYGPGMSIYDGRVQADFLNNVIHGENIVLKSDGSSVRTYTYIADAVTAMFMVLLFSEDMVYNIADEASETTIKQLAETLAGFVDGIRVVFDIPKEAQKGTASFKNGILSTEKIRRELGWQPRYSIKDGFHRTLLHLREELELS